MGKNKEDFEDKWKVIFRLLEGDLSLLVFLAYVRTKHLRCVSGTVYMYVYPVG
jgi:hypothetical protein